MTRSRLTSRILALCALVLGLMAFTTASAQAELGSYWGYKEGAKLPQFGTALEPFVGTAFENNYGALLTTIGKTKVEIACAGLQSTGEMKFEAVGRIRGKFRFVGCAFRVEGKTITACEPFSAGEIVSTMQTVMLEGLIRLHQLGDKTLDETVLFKPTVLGKSLIVIQLGSECAFGESLTVDGEFSVKDCENTFLVHKESHLVEEFAPLTKLKVNGNPGTLDGSAFVGLVGEHAGLAWAGTPG